MEPGHNTILVLLIILSAGLIGPELFKKLRIPYITPLIIFGAVLGPHGFSYVEPNEIIQFFGFLGFAFLMFLAGLETKPENIRKNLSSIIALALINGLIPFFTGFLVIKAFGYGFIESLLVGTIFTSSSIAIIIPSIRETKLYKKIEGQKMISAVLLEDTVSLVALAVILQKISPITSLPISIYLLVLLLSFAGLKILLPKIANLVVSSRWFNKKEEHEEQLQFIIVVLISVLVFFSALGVHPMLAAFLVGLLLANIITSPEIREKIHTLGYGLFVPVFFFIVGMELNLDVFVSIDTDNLVLPALIISAIASKFISGFVAGKITNMPNGYASIFGLISTSHLTTALAATFAASSIGLLDTTLTTAIITLTVITTIVVPVAVKILIRKC